MHTVPSFVLTKISPNAGIPTLAPSFLPKDVKVWVQSENGILGMVSMWSGGYHYLAQLLNRLSRDPTPLKMKSIRKSHYPRGSRAREPH